MTRLRPQPIPCSITPPHPHRTRLPMRRYCESKHACKPLPRTVTANANGDDRYGRPGQPLHCPRDQSHPQHPRTYLSPRTHQCPDSASLLATGVLHTCLPPTGRIQRPRCGAFVTARVIGCRADFLTYRQRGNARSTPGSRRTPKAQHVYIYHSV